MKNMLVVLFGLSLLLPSACSRDDSGDETVQDGKTNNDTAGDVKADAGTQDTTPPPEDTTPPPEDTTPPPEDTTPPPEDTTPPPEDTTPPPQTAFVINEFVVTPTEQEAVEVYNGAAQTMSLKGWTFHTLTEGEKIWTISDMEVLPGGTVVLNASNMTPPDQADSLLPNAGAVIWLADAAGAKVDEVAFGTRGSTPGPIYATSAARVQDGVDTDNGALDWNWDPTPTVGAPNDVAGVKLGSPLTLSELAWSKDDDAGDYIEMLVWAGAFNGDVSGWTLVFSGGGSGDDYVFAAGTQVQTPFWVLDEAQFPEFANLKDKGVLYLFDKQGTRIYQMGWTGLLNDGTKSLGYLPGEQGPADCFDTATCALKTLTPTKGAENKL